MKMRKFPRTGLREFDIFAALKTPAEIQDFINSLAVNFEEKGETAQSPLLSLRSKKIHCMEGAFLAAAILWCHGEAPLVMNLRTGDEDTGHAVALFKMQGKWGAISKTNHPVLRYRDPVFANPRELAMSYFHEYFLNDGSKTLREWSKPFDMLQFDDAWLTADFDLWIIVDAIESSRHFPIVPRGVESSLRPADPIEIRASNFVEYKQPRKKPERW